MKNSNEKKSALPIDPSGVDESCYYGYQDWSYERWAWEFLKRNEEFRAQCRNLPKKKKHRAAQEQYICKEFKLRRFKHADEAFDEGKNPRFAVFMEESHLEHDGANKVFTVTMTPGAVLCGFNVRQAIDDHDYIRVQTKATKIALERALRSFKETHSVSPISKSLDVTPVSLSKFEYAELYRCLRLYDMRRSRTPVKTRYRVIGAYAGGDIDSQISNATRKAVAMVEKGYLELMKKASHTLPSVGASGET